MLEEAVSAKRTEWFSSQGYAIDDVFAWDPREIFLVSLNGNLLHGVGFWVELGGGYDK